MATTIPDDKSEAIVSLWADEPTIYVSLHTADPGKIGTAEAQGVGRVAITTAQWSAFDDDETTGGRLKDNTIELDFGNTSQTETYSHFGFWDDDDTNAEAEWLGGAALVSPQTVESGNQVRFPIGNLDIVGAGHGQTGDEGS